MATPAWFAKLRHEAAILPSMLQCDFADLRSEIARLEGAGAKALHLDVMDGQFVPNFTYGMPIVAAIRSCTTLPLDVHLMVDRPERYLASFRDAGADGITVHAEAVSDLSKTIAEIHALGATAGVAINPDTPVDLVASCATECDLLLIMSVQAGFGGQSFRPQALEKLREARTLLPPTSVVQVDGGVNLQTIRACAEAGANWFVVGSAILGQADYARAFAKLFAHAQNIIK